MHQLHRHSNLGTGDEGQTVPAGAQTASPAGAQTTREASATLNEATVHGTVQAVDHTARTVTVQGADGKSVTLDVPPTATRFDQVKVGDMVTMSYYDKVSVRPKPADEPAVNRAIEPTTTPTPGALPGATRAVQHVATMTLTALDPATRSVTFSGPKGTAYTRFVVDTVNPAVFSSLKTGDRVDVTWTDAITLQLAPAAPSSAAAAPAPPPADTFRHRTTISVQFGVDNSFSGQMIKAATGATTGGAPINLNETTFDDVYGRIGMLKIGAGYRTSPRTETVANFVWSDSSAQDSATNVGTVGTNPQIPLDVNFTSYKYLGNRRRQSVVLRANPLHTLCRLSRRAQPTPEYPRHVRGCAAARPRRDSRPRMASSSRNPGRSASVRLRACSSAWGRSRSWVSSSCVSSADSRMSTGSSKRA